MKIGYRVKVAKLSDETGWMGCAPDLPGCPPGHGASVPEAVRATFAEMRVWIEERRRRGLFVPPPKPSGEEWRELLRPPAPPPSGLERPKAPPDPVKMRELRGRIRF